MVAVTPETYALRQRIDMYRNEIDTILKRYGASDPQLFGSVARGEAGSTSDIDLMVNFDSPKRRLMRLAGLSEELSNLLGVRVDVVIPEMLKTSVSETAREDAVAL